MDLRPIAFHPGVYIRDELKERHWSRFDFTQKTGWSRAVVDAVLDEKMGIDGVKAGDLSKVFGTSVVLWSRLQTSWERYVRHRLSKEGWS